MSRRHTSKHAEALSLHQKPEKNGRDNDPLNHLVEKESRHGKHTVEVNFGGGKVNVPPGSLTKQLTNYCDSRIPLQGGATTNVFSTSSPLEFELKAVSCEIVTQALLRISLQNNHASVDWTLPNLWRLIDRIQILWNGADVGDTYYSDNLGDMIQLFSRNIDAAAALMHFHPPSEGGGPAYMPRNQSQRFNSVGAVSGPVDYDATGTLSYPPVIPSTEPLVVPFGTSRDFYIDLTSLPLFKGDVYFPTTTKHAATRIRIYFAATGQIAGDSHYSNGSVTISGVTQSRKLHLEAARQANELQLTSMELILRGSYNQSTHVKSELEARHNTFMFRCLIPNRMILQQACTTGIKNSENKTITSMHGTYAMWIIRLRDPDSASYPGKADWIDSITTISENNSDGTIRDYEDKNPLLFSTTVDEHNFNGGNFFSYNADWGQFMHADPDTRGALVTTTGVPRAVGADSTGTKPYYHSYGKDKRLLCFPYSQQPLKDFWWGTCYGSQTYDGNSTVTFTPGPNYYGYSYTGAQKQMIIDGWRISYIHWDGRQWRTIKPS
jgi:hypothetical protein